MVVLDPNDTSTHDTIISKKSQKKKGRVPAISILAAPPWIITDAASPAPNNRVHKEMPSKVMPKRTPAISTLSTSTKVAAAMRTSPTVNEMVLNLNNQVAEMGLDPSILSELETTSSDVAPIRPPLPSTVIEHESESANDVDQPRDAKAQTPSPEKVVHKRSNLLTNLGNHTESIKKGAKNRVFNFTLKRFSLNSAPIRLPPCPPEVLDGSTPSNTHTAASIRVDPPASPAFPEDDPSYQARLSFTFWFLYSRGHFQKKSDGKRQSHDS
jgi:hypothetical protein